MVIFDYNDLNISAGSIQSSSDREGLISILICGNDSNEEKGFMHFFTYDFDNKQKNNIYFSFYDYCLSRKVTKVIFPKDANEDGNIYFTDSCLKKVNKINWESSIITEEVYDKLLLYNTNSNQPLLIGMNNRTGLAMIDLNEEKESGFGNKMLYPGKKNLINDYIVGNDRIVICSNDNKISYFDMRE